MNAISPTTPRSPLRTVDASTLAGLPVPARAWHVDELIPAHTVTLLGGDGGTGKSLLALQLAVATAAGAFWAGRSPEPGGVVYLSAEDDIDEIHRRVADICTEAEINLQGLAGLSIVPLAGEDAILAAPDRNSNVLRPTPLFAAVDAHIGQHKPRLVVLDTLADLFGGEENQRAQARQFIGMVRGWCIRHDTTVLLLAHPSLTGMASGSGSSGSTAWNNSVRSRLYLERVKGDDGTEADPDLRTLVAKKSNYGKTGQKIRLTWQRGVFRVAAASDSSFSAIAAQSKAERTFLALLAAYRDEGRYVSPTQNAPTFAPAVFAKDPRADGVKKQGFIDAMNRLFANSSIKVRQSDGPPSKRRDIIAITEETP